MGANLQESRDLATAQAQLNRFNQVTPFGSLEFTGPLDRHGRVDPFQTTATTTLSPELQRLFGTLTGAAGTPFNFAPGRAGGTGVGNPFNLLNLMKGNDLNFEQSRKSVEDATFQRAMALLNPELARSEETLRQRLANQGLPQASRAATAELGRFEDTSNRAREQAALASVLAGGQEQSRQLSDLLGTSSIGIGQARDQRQQALQEALIKRQLPLQEIMPLFGLQTPGNYIAPGATQVQSLATPGSPSFLEQAALGLIGAGGNIAGGYFAGR